MICAMAALTMLATACKDKGEQFEINGRIAEADGKTLYFRAMKRPGFEADRFGHHDRLAVLGPGGEVRAPPR